MTKKNRIFRSSFLSWLRMGVLAFFQLVATPVFLQYWSADRYGYWLLLQAIVGVLSVLAASHQYYVGFELMRSGRGRERVYSAYVGGGIYISKIITLIQLLVAVVIALVLARYSKEGTYFSGLFDEVGLVLLANVLLVFLPMNEAAIWERVVVANGGYDRVAVWAIVLAVVSTVLPLTILYFSKSFLIVGLFSAVGLSITQFFYKKDMMKCGAAHLSRAVFLRRRTAWRNFYRAQLLTLKTVVENIRLQGARLVLAPLAGIEMLATFATFRTGANIATQAISGVTAPLTPRIMDAVRSRNQGEFDKLAGGFWLFIAVLVAPGAIAVQYYGKPLFEMWTRGKIAFDPLLLGFLSASVLINALSQPALMLVQGNNIIMGQVWNTLASGAAMILGFVLLIPVWGVKGAGAALFFSEVLALVWYIVIASKWLVSVGMKWPRKMFSYGLLTSLIIITGLILLPFIDHGLAFLGGLGLLFLFCIAGLIKVIGPRNLIGVNY